jgi:NCAIR mutase (PurE)-related protein
MPTVQIFVITNICNFWQDSDLFSELLRGLEAVVFCDGEDAEETLAAAEVVVADGRVVLLAGRVQDVDLNLLAVKNNLDPVSRF